MDDFYRVGIRHVGGDQSDLSEMGTAEFSWTHGGVMDGDPAREIAIGPDGAVWLLKKAPNTGLDDDREDFELFSWNGTGWDRVPGGLGVAVTADSRGVPWLAQASGAVVRRTGTTWERLPGSVSRLSGSADGSVWAIGTEPVEGGREILRWSGDGWEVIPGGAVRIAVSPSGEAWVINDREHIFRRLGGRWLRVQGGAVDIAFGADGNCWIVSNSGGMQGGYGVLRWNRRDWDKIDGAAVRVAVQPNGMPWLLNIRGHAYRRHLTQ